MPVKQIQIKTILAIIGYSQSNVIVALCHHLTFLNRAVATRTFNFCLVSVELLHVFYWNKDSKRKSADFEW